MNVGLVLHRWTAAVAVYTAGMVAGMVAGMGIHPAVRALVGEWGYAGVVLGFGLLAGWVCGAWWLAERGETMRSGDQEGVGR